MAPVWPAAEEGPLYSGKDSVGCVRPLSFACPAKTDLEPLIFHSTIATVTDNQAYWLILFCVSHIIIEPIGLNSIGGGNTMISRNDIQAIRTTRIAQLSWRRVLRTSLDSIIQRGTTDE